MCASRNREHHIIWTTACPVCQAPIGQPCHWDGKLEHKHGGRLAVHSERRLEWQRAGNPKVEL